MADLEQKFQKAAEDVKNLKLRPNDEELLDVYALFKQATVGDCNQSQPSMFQLKEKAKHESWLRKKGMDLDKAKEAYVNLANKLVKTYGLKD